MTRFERVALVLFGLAIGALLLVALVAVDHASPSGCAQCAACAPC